jgi:hypothetical protein
MNETISGIGAFVAAAGLFSMLVWQIRIGPKDGQERAALVFILLLTVLIGQLCIAYLGGPSMGNTARGNLSWWAWCVSVAVLAWRTHRINVAALAKRRERGG